ncbi:MAG: hypothetical protein BWY77_01488 [bacterium ADurb.Bin431]|nr:MAG: hypothetical protein BWY77_01488 [bacterium ADurb.Bin431]
MHHLLGADLVECQLLLSAARYLLVGNHLMVEPFKRDLLQAVAVLAGIEQVGAHHAVGNDARKLDAAAPELDDLMLDVVAVFFDALIFKHRLQLLQRPLPVAPAFISGADQRQVERLLRLSRKRYA